MLQFTCLYICKSENQGDYWISDRFLEPALLFLIGLCSGRSNWWIIWLMETISQLQFYYIFIKCTIVHFTSKVFAWWLLNIRQIPGTFSYFSSLAVALVGQTDQSFDVVNISKLIWWIALTKHSKSSLCKQMNEYNRGRRLMFLCSWSNPSIDQIQNTYTSIFLPHYKDGGFLLQILNTI